MAVTVNNEIKICSDGALPLISELCNKIELKKIIDEKIDDQNKKIVSTGNAVKAMIMNIIVGRKPLYLVDKFYEPKDTEKLFGEGIGPEHLNDDVMGRALDELYKIGAKKVLTETAMMSLQKFNIPVTSIHADTTSKSVYGDYEDCELDEDVVQIKHGHNKDHRPDLKQFLFGLGVTKDKIVVIGDVSDGNKSDKAWNKDILGELRKSMKQYGLKDFVYVADSAAVTEEMLKALNGIENEEITIPFVSRLPGNYSLEQNLRHRASENKNWTDIGKFSEKENAAQYKIQTFEDELHGKKYDFIVCASDHLDTRKQKQLQKSIDAEKKTVTAAIAKFHKQEFFFEKDAQETFILLQKELSPKYHQLELKISSKERYEKRNRPGKPSKYDVRKKETVYIGAIKHFEDDVKIQELRNDAGMFVLITNSLKNGKLSAVDTFREYKEQISVENCFQVLKDPDFIDELFLKTPQRLEALGYVMLMALMILSILERNVRVALRGTKERVKIFNQLYRNQPTGRNIIGSFEGLHMTMVLDPKTKQWQRFCTIDKFLLRLLELAGFDADIYTKSPTLFN